MIDFSTLPRKNKAYAGANGSKISVIYNDEQYMLKFPPAPRKNLDMSYTNSCISEYIGSHIFNTIGIKAQETLLGKFIVSDKEKIVVACKDFTSLGITLQDFASLKNQVITSPRGGYGTELSDVLYAIEDQQSVDPHILTERFWDMFIVDALIANFDRHGSNWGFIKKNNKYRLSPIFDNGSSLFPQLNTDEKIMAVLNDQNEIDQRIYTFPTSQVQHQGKKSSYYKIISSLDFEECNHALVRITERVDLNKINKLIDTVDGISEIRKEFYKTIIKQRFEKILLESYNKLKSR